MLYLILSYSMHRNKSRMDTRERSMSQSVCIFYTIVQQQQTNQATCRFGPLHMLDSLLDPLKGTETN